MWNRCIFLLGFSLFVVSDATNSWNYLMFSQTWPQTVCRVWKSVNASHTCVFPKMKDPWSIHGIWPSVTGSDGPEFCNQTWPFDIAEIKSIEDELMQGWINVYVGTAPDNLWSHEWNKHGTCAATIKPLNSQLKYFTQGLSWLKTYTMSSILSQANILPSNTKGYSQEDFINAIRDKLGVECDINCLHDTRDPGKQYLWELRICFSKSFKMIHCKADESEYGRVYYLNNVHYISNCNPNVDVIYSDSVTSNQYK